MKRHYALKAYKAALQLYPKRFRRDYAEQMFLTAEDAMQSAQTHRAVAKVAGRLVVDLLVTLVKENTKQICIKVVKHTKDIRQKSKRLAVLRAFQFAGIGLATYVWLSFAFINFNALRRINTESFIGGYMWTWAAELVVVIILLAFVPLTFVVLHKVTSLSLWRKITWSYGFGLLAATGYLFVTYLANAVSINLTSQSHNYEWLIALIYLGSYYAMLHKFLGGRRFMRREAKQS